ncbi:MAG: bepC [Verrucomicrobiales bacterium]|nr:bepC [Verrucomicrobiales bacterium]
MQLTKHAAIVLSCIAVGLNAQTPITPGAVSAAEASNNPNVRVLSLDEAVRLALEHSFDIKIQQLNPQIARFRLQSSYGVYDPRLNIVASHRDFTQEGQIVGGVTNATTHQRVDGFGIGIASFPKTDRTDPNFVAGLLPTGMRYELFANANHRTGSVAKGPIDQYDGDVGFNLRQPLLRDMWIDDARATIALRKKDVTISEFDLQQVMMDKVLAARQTYFDLVAANDNVKVYEKALELANQAVADTKKRVQVGTVLPLTETSAESAAATSRADLLAAKRQRDLQENILKSMITDNYEKWHTLSIAPSERLLAVPQAYNLEASWLDGLTLRPDFNRLRAEVEQQGIQVKLAKNQRFPWLDLTFSAGRSAVASTFTGATDDVGSGRDPFWAGGLIFSIPFTFTQERNNVNAARTRMQQMEMQLQRAHQTVIISIDDAMKQAQSAYERVAATREARSFAEQALDAALKRFEQNKITSYEVLQVQRDLTAARGQEIRTLADYNKALSNLYLNEGTILRRSGLELKVK